MVRVRIRVSGQWEGFGFHPVTHQRRQPRTHALSKRAPSRRRWRAAPRAASKAWRHARQCASGTPASHSTHFASGRRGALADRPEAAEAAAPEEGEEEEAAAAAAPEEEEEEAAAAEAAAAVDAVEAEPKVSAAPAPGAPPGVRHRKRCASCRRSSAWLGLGLGLGLGLESRLG